LGVKGVIIPVRTTAAIDHSWMRRTAEEVSVGSPRESSSSWALLISSTSANLESMMTKKEEKLKKLQIGD
jgi:hypothetical protein